MNKPEINSLVKVWLPGEIPWVKVISHTKKGFMGRIDNKLYAEISEFEKAQFTKKHFGTGKRLPKLHDYKYNDVVEFIWYDDGMGARFMPNVESQEGGK